MTTVALAAGTGVVIRRDRALLFDVAGANAEVCSRFQSASDDQAAVDAVKASLVDAEFAAAPLVAVTWFDGIGLTVFGPVEVRTSARQVPMVSGAHSDTWIEHRIDAEGPTMISSGAGGECRGDLQLGSAPAAALELTIDESHSVPTADCDAPSISAAPPPPPPPPPPPVAPTASAAVPIGGHESLLETLPPAPEMPPPPERAVPPEAVASSVIDPFEVWTEAVESAPSPADHFLIDLTLGGTTAGTDSRRAVRFTKLWHQTPLVMIAIAIVTVLLAIPLLTMAPSRSASTEPSGDVFVARDRIDDRFVGSALVTPFIAEPVGGNVLAAAPLQELVRVGESLRNHPTLGPTLSSWYAADAGIDVTGMATFADHVAAELNATLDIDLAEAVDEQVNQAGAAVIERFGVDSDLLGLSTQTHQNEAGEWVVPAVLFRVQSDDSVLGFGNVGVNLGGDTAPEEYRRSLEAVFADARGWTVRGVAIDVNLTSEDQGAVAGPFIGLAILAALLVVGVIFRSYWVLAVVSGAFLILLIWLKGISNLIGLDDSLVLSLIVPIAMISFGVDYAFHSVGRYREERAAGKVAGRAAPAAAVGVSAALVLATASDSVAFLANTTAGIESVVQFGIGAAVALLAAYVLLGVATPLIVAWIEMRVPAPREDRTGQAMRVLAAFGAAALAVASVLLLVFLLPWLGVVLAAVTIGLTLVVPVAVLSKRDEPAMGQLPFERSDTAFAEVVGRTVTAIAGRWKLVLPAAAIVTVLAATLAVQVPTRFDVEDFFSVDTDFVRSLDSLDEHIGGRSGEVASIYIEGNLTDPARLAAVAALLDEFRESETTLFARDGDGVVIAGGGLFEVFDAAWASPRFLDLVFEQTGVVATDSNGDAIPDAAGQIEAMLAVASRSGIPLDDQRQTMTAGDVAVRVNLRGIEPDATVIHVAVPNSREQANVRAARAELEALAGGISDELDGSFVQATGSALVREGSLEGTHRALLISLPVAVLACLAIAAYFLRSIRFGLASVVPIVMVVAWLYGFMKVAGFGINLVTATIAAVSIGIGIDFSLHYVVRYREELARWGQRSVAVRVAAEGTGVALVASAVSSATGFGILALAPMPLFASYGLLTAIMVAMALIATMAVLPSLLVCLTHDDEPVVVATPLLDAIAEVDQADGVLVAATPA